MTAEHWRPLMDQPPLFPWQHLTGEISVCGVWWYLPHGIRRGTQG